MQTVPKISVVIPTYNYANFLGEAIQSVLDQTFTDFELIIVDNCSTDNTDEVVTKYLSDSRVSYYKNDTNLGLVGNWNKCLEYARGEYIKFLCADDKFRPQLLEKYVAVMDTHPNLALLSAYNEIFGARSLCRISPFKGYVHAPLVIEDLLGRNNRLRSPSVCMFRKQHAEQAGRFNPKLHQYADRDYYIRLLAFGDCYFLPEPLCFARTHPGTQSALVRKKNMGSFLNGTG
jgi:glycosyltransferase involved in cell wall biosynthesis